ncbi:unnamed protein product, partial [Anisakis simplex]|uniref:Uncharacterized protein n=1 Tax=Anisakis simplex TaxID=6269 RepID=A0A0M3J7G4_ANISI
MLLSIFEHLQLSDDSMLGQERLKPSQPLGQCWSAPANIIVRQRAQVTGGNETGNVDCPSPESPLNYCWSAPEFLDDTDEEDADVDRVHGEMKATLKGLFKRSASYEFLKTLYSDYDEPKRPNFLDLGNELPNEAALNAVNFQANAEDEDDQPPVNHLVPLATNDKFGSLELYGATPSPQREDDRVFHVNDESDEDEDKESLNPIDSPAGQRIGSESPIEFIDSGDESGLVAANETTTVTQASHRARSCDTSEAIDERSFDEGEYKLNDVWTSHSTGHLDERNGRRIW